MFFDVDLGTKAMIDPVEPYNAVALLDDQPGTPLSRGQVGTVVDVLDPETVMVEFSDDDGRTYALEPLRRDRLLVLHYVPAAA
jgi:hypothetical protein